VVEEQGFGWTKHSRSWAAGR